MKKLLTLLAILSFLIPSISYGAIAFDANANGTQSSPNTSLTFAHTNASNATLLLIWTFNTGGSDVVNGVTYNGVSASRITQICNHECVQLYALPNPATGTNNVVVTVSSAPVVFTAMTSSYTGASAQLPEASNTASNLGDGTTATPVSASVTTVTSNAWVVGALRGQAGSEAAGASASLRSSANEPVLFERSDNPISSPGSTALNLTYNGAAGSSWSSELMVASIAPSTSTPATTAPKMQVIWLDQD